MATPEGFVSVPRWVAEALVGPATIHEQGRARAALAAVLNHTDDAEEA